MIKKLISKTRAYKDLEQQAQRARNEVSAVKGINSHLKRENDQLSERVGDIAKQLSTARIEITPTNRYSVCVDIDPEMVERGLIHGNDTVVVDHIGRHIGHQVAYEIKRMNFRRTDR